MMQIRLLVAWAGSRAKLAALLSVSRNTVDNWMIQRAQPNDTSVRKMDALLIIADPVMQSRRRRTFNPRNRAPIPFTILGEQ